MLAQCPVDGGVISATLPVPLLMQELVLSGASKHHFG